MSYLLDTNTLIYYFKGMGNVAGRLLTTPPGEIALSAIVLFELEVGIAKSTAPRKRKAHVWGTIVEMVRARASRAKLIAASGARATTAWTSIECRCNGR